MTTTNNPSDDSTPNLEAILRRVRKLLAIAEDSRADPNEAAAAAQQAEKIMRHYQIDNADAMIAGMQSGTDFGEVSTGSGLNPFDPKAAYHAACGQIAVAVAKLNDCQARLIAANRKIEFCGLRIDAILARFTYTMLVNSMVATADLWKQRNKTTAQARQEYIDGYARAVCELLRKAREAREADARVPGAFGALVVAKAALVRSHYGDPRYSKGRGSYASANAAAGYAAGSRVDVGRRGLDSAPGRAALTH